MNKPIFIHIPKTGGQSIATALKDEIDIFGHKFAETVKEKIDHWDSVFKFSKWTHNTTFDEWVCGRLTERFYALEKPKTQHNYLNEDGKIIVDFIARFENLEEDFKKICSNVGVNKTLTHENITVHEHYSSYYSKESKIRIAEMFKDDIEFFEYEYEG